MKKPGIITLLTDFGLSDPYVAMMKGVILTINPNAQVVDISHNIKAGSISLGSDLIKETYSYFPAGTVHVVVIDPGVGGSRRPVGIEANGHVFIGPDNGVFWPIIKANKDNEIIHLTNRAFFLESVTKTFHGREIFAPVAAHLTAGVDLRSMGESIEDPTRLDIPVVLNKSGSIYGEVIRVDNFGNIITNISGDDLEDYLKEFKLLIRIGDIEIDDISNTYTDVAEGELLALINSSNLLEIAVNLGRASEFIGIDQNKIIGTLVNVEKRK